MAAADSRVPCLGSNCRMMVIVEPGKPTLCQLCARAAVNTKASIVSKEDAAQTKHNQQRHRYGGRRWQREMRRRNDNKLRTEIRAADADMAAAAQSVPINRFGGNRLSSASGHGSSSQYSPAPMDSRRGSGSHNTLSRAGGSEKASSMAPRRFSEEFPGLGNRVSKTGRIRQASFLMEDADDSPPYNPVGSMMPPPRPPQHHIVNRQENRDSYNDDELAENPIRSMGAPSREYADSYSERNYKQRNDKISAMSTVNNLRTNDGNTRGYHHVMTDKNLGPAMLNQLQQKRRDRQEAEMHGRTTSLRLNSHHGERDKKQVSQGRLSNRHGGLVDSDEEPGFTSYVDTKHTLDNRERDRDKISSSRRVGQSQFREAADDSRVSYGKRRHQEPTSQRPGKRIRFKSSLAPHNSSNSALLSSQTWAIPKNIKAMIPPPESIADMGPIGILSVAKSESLGAPDDDSALLDHNEGASDADESIISERTLPLTEKMSKWLGDDATEDTGKAKELQSRSNLPGRQTLPVDHSVAHTERKLTRFERGVGVPKNQPEVNSPSARAQKYDGQPLRTLTRSEIEALDNQLKCQSPAVLVPRYQPSETGDSKSSSSVRSTSVRSVARDSPVDALIRLQDLPFAIMKGTLKPTTPQKGSKYGTPTQVKNSTPNLGIGKTHSVSRKLFSKNDTSKYLDPRDAVTQKPVLIQEEVQQRESQASVNAEEGYDDNTAIVDKQDIHPKDGYPKHWSIKQCLDAYLNDETGALAKPSKSRVPETPSANDPAQEVLPAIPPQADIDEDLPNFQLNYPSENVDVGTNQLINDLLDAMDSEPNLVGNEAALPPLGKLVDIDGISTNRNGLQTISAQAVRAMEGLPPGSQINDDVMLRIVDRVQQGTLTEIVAPVQQQTQEDEDEREILHQLMLEEIESKKKKYEEERTKLTRMSEAGENVAKQRMVVRLLGVKLDKFVEQHELGYSREPMA